MHNGRGDSGVDDGGGGGVGGGSGGVDIGGNVVGGDGGRSISTLQDSTPPWPVGISPADPSPDKESGHSAVPQSFGKLVGGGDGGDDGDGGGGGEVRATASAFPPCFNL
jgi:hypothetical protein